jgi:hypothetical protein
MTYPNLFEQYQYAQQVSPENQQDYYNKVIVPQEQEVQRLKTKFNENPIYRNQVYQSIGFDLPERQSLEGQKQQRDDPSKDLFPISVWDPDLPENQPDYSQQSYYAMQQADLEGFLRLLSIISDRKDALAVEHKEAIEEYYELSDQVTSLASERSQAMLPILKPLVGIDSPVDVGPYLNSLLMSFMYGAIKGEVAPAWVLPINDVHEMEKQYNDISAKGGGSDLSGRPYKGGDKPTRLQFVEMASDVNLIKTTEQIQTEAAVALTALAALPFSRHIISAISDFIYRARMLHALQDAADVEVDVDIPEGDHEPDTGEEPVTGDTYITHNYPDNGGGGDFDSERWKTLNRDINSLRSLTGNALKEYQKMIEALVSGKGGGGGSARVNCDEILAQYNEGKIPWSSVPKQCRTQVSGVGNSEARGPENDYPTII